MKKQFLFFGIGLSVLVSCSENSTQETSTEGVVTIQAAEEDAETLKANKEAIAEMERAEAELKSSVTSMTIDKMEHDFGTIKVNSENQCTFVVTNTGKKPLIISDVKASCGCTTPVKPEKPIMPGKSDKIEVGFKPTGPGPSEKTVTITSNAEPRIEVVKIKANVK